MGGADAFRKARIAILLLGVVGFSAWIYFLRANNPPPLSEVPAAIASPGMLATADVKVGAQLTSICNNCHSFEAGGPHKVGPNLFGIYGAQVARHADFNYSEGLKRLRGQTWTAEHLYDFLRNPAKFAPKTTMSFDGMLDPQDRLDVVAYLRTLR